MTAKSPTTSHWFLAWSVLLSLAWLRPDHFPPWTTADTDGWAAVVLAVVATVILVRSKVPVVWHSITILAAVLVAVPGLQYGFGLVLSPGTAWISSAYLLGFLLALLTGARWESTSPSQMADGLFLAIGMAALLSVGLQLHQWTGLNVLGIWSVGGTLDRPFANFGQPNNLGTFLLWGVLATAWGVARQYIGVKSALGIAVFLLFGLALTQSRTAWVAVVLLVAASWLWRGVWPDRRWPWFFLGLGAFFAVCVVSMGWVNQVTGLKLASDLGSIARISGEQRPVIWAFFVDAALQKPWLGYGWNQVALAQVENALNHPALHIFVSHSHNLFLDLVLWCGVPMGLFVSFYLVRWFWQRLRAVRDAENALLMMLLLVVGNHAMLELPLHHAFFLLPAGLVMGALNVRLQAKPVFSFNSRWSVGVVWLLAVSILVLVVRDYAQVEQAYLNLRVEYAKKTQTKASPPEVLLLTQWHDFFDLARLEPTKGMSDAQLARLRNSAALSPGVNGFYKLATALAMNQQPAEAQLWLGRLCSLAATDQCSKVHRAWMILGHFDPAIAAVPWPVKAE
jgi:O-antigen ligase